MLMIRFWKRARLIPSHGAVLVMIGLRGETLLHKRSSRLFWRKIEGDVVDRRRRGWEGFIYIPLSAMSKPLCTLTGV
jgi:hypothetical protein